MGAKLGQNFLVDPNILRKIMALTAPSETETVVEVGCGAGIMTRTLWEGAKQLYVVEIDETCIINTKKNLGISDSKDSPDGISFAKRNPIFIHGDVLEVGFRAVPKSDYPFRIIANIPYYISAKFIALCAAYKHHLTDITLMLQWEFAKKLVSKPGESGYTPLAIFAQMHFDIRLDFQVSRHCFRPAPKVDSAIVTLTPKALPEDLLADDDFFLFVKAVFWGRRKPLKSALHKSPYWTVKEGYVSHPIWEKLGTTRAEVLSREQLLETYRVLAPYLEKVPAKGREVFGLE
jgi:16S rRNA (adenine1518-N6/adenine1519-N6)-dimethyltransferase